MDKLAFPDAWTLLIVDTDGAVGERLSQSLEAAGSMRQAFDLSEAMATLAEYPFDAILLSLTLPDTPGMEALKTIRQAAPESAIIVLDCDMNRDRAATAARQGAHDYFAKTDLDPGLLCTALSASVASNRAEGSLRRSENKFRGILETLDEAYYELDLVGRFTYVNDTLCRHLQRPREELIGRQSLDFSSPETSERIRQRCIEIYATGKSDKLVDNEVIRKDGTHLHVEHAISLMRDLSGEPIGFSGISRDVTDNKRARQALLVSEEKYRNILESIEDGYFEVDLSGTFTFFNDAMIAIIGYTRDELHRMRFSDYMGAGDARNVEAAYKSIYSSGHPNHLLQYEVIRKDGHRAHIESAVSLVRDASGRPMGFRGIARDITLRKRVEQELARAKEKAEAATLAKSNFLSNMSHEIRTPMNGIFGMYDLLLGTDLTDEQTDFVETGKRSADGMLSVINDILDFSKIESGELEVTTIVFSLPKVFKEAIAVTAMQAREKGLEWICRVDAQVPDRLVGDPGRLRQILTNLTNNAIKFTDSGRIVLTVGLQEQSKTSATIRFSVADTGIGISKVDQARLFNAFEQVDASTTRKYGGTGLGLVIAKRLTELMGGQMGVESEPGRGTTFWFAVPFQTAGPLVTQEHQHMDHLEGHETADTGSEPKPDEARILLAEDNEINQKLAMHLIERFGYHGHAVDNGRQAVAALSDNDFDLVLMDIQMPEMDGFEATAVIRDPSSKVRNHAIPIVALTAHAMKGDREKCLNAGMDDYVPKPVNVEMLRQTIERHLPSHLRKTGLK